MSESFGTKIPDYKDIVKIDGKNVIDKDGNVFDRGTVKWNKELGGGFERVSASLFDDPHGLKENEEDEELDED